MAHMPVLLLGALIAACAPLFFFTSRTMSGALTRSSSGIERRAYFFAPTSTSFFSRDSS
jgi:hypothetical protein